MRGGVEEVGRLRWPGEWLWPPRADAGPGGLFHEARPAADPDRNAYVRYRARFELAHLPGSATLWLSADGRYLAFVNGHRIGRGPAASDADVREIDRHDVRRLLTRGANVVAVLVHSYGVDTASYTRASALTRGAGGGGALYAHLELDDRLELASATTWRCQRAAEWLADTPQVNESLGFVEVRDARLEPLGWEDVPFDDTGWDVAARCAPSPTIPGRTYFPVLRERVVPQPREEIARPVNWTASETEETPAPEPAEILARLRTEPRGPLAACSAEATPEGGFLVRPSPGRAVRLLLDFGTLIAARPRIDVDGVAGAVLDVATAEAIDSEGRPAVDLFGSRHGHRFILRDGPQVLERWDWVGFRYLEVALRGTASPIAFRSVSALSLEDPSPRVGAFACSDESLTLIWEAGARTLRLTATDLIYSDIAREQRQWIGDLPLGAIFATTGRTPLVPHALRHIADAEPFGAFLPMWAPGDYRGVATTIPDYTLRWLLSLGEYHEWSGDHELVESLYPVILRSIRAFEPYMDESGLLTDVPYWHFIDWAALPRDGIAGPLNGLYLLALDASARLAVVAGHAREAGRLRALGRRVRAAFRERLFAPVDGLFRDAPGARLFSQHTNAFALLGGAVPSRMVGRVAATLGDRRRLRVTAMGRIVPREDADDDYEAGTHLVMAQPSLMNFVLAALRTAGRSDLALDLIRDRWGPMGTPGGTCWETWSGRHSRCHPWATGPTAELPRILLGVRPLAPGFSRVRIEPYPGTLTWARGRVPTPRGEIAVSWTREGAELALETEIPAGITAELPGGEVLAAGTHARRLAVPRP